MLLRKCLRLEPSMRPSSQEIEKEDFRKLLPESVMRNEGDEMAGTRSVECLNAAAPNVRKQFEKKTSSSGAGRFMTS